MHIMDSMCVCGVSRLCHDSYTDDRQGYSRLLNWGLESVVSMNAIILVAILAIEASEYLFSTE